MRGGDGSERERRGREKRRRRTWARPGEKTALVVKVTRGRTSARRALKMKRMVESGYDCTKECLSRRDAQMAIQERRDAHA